MAVEDVANLAILDSELPRLSMKVSPGGAQASN